ncbi:hypothetical protein EU523_01215 [Candidatus Heimdallarchaeota archaeon]|nr:MAG: hypothetical protein EU523_01215 [Candidatus Heimdallarchaeota archaeon]
MKHQKNNSNNNYNKKTTEKDERLLTEKNKKEVKESIFKKIGILITKKYKYILIVWLIIFGCSIYPTIQLQKVISYNETEFLPDNLEYNKGEAIKNDLFPSNITGSTIIVIDSDNLISSEENMEYIEELTNRIVQQYNENINEIQSVLSILQSFNESYWQMIAEAEEELQNRLGNEITELNQIMYSTETEIENLWSSIANVYSLTWFNLSRTYYYGFYDTNLFTAGPTPTIYDTIAHDTNITSLGSITSSYVNMTYSVITEQFTNISKVWDSLIHPVTLGITNTTLYQYINQEQNLTLEEYHQEIYPFLSRYHQNWTEIFTQNITQSGLTIINGTEYNNNLYSNSSLMEAHSSQMSVLEKLHEINNTVLSSFNITNYILNEISSSLDFSTWIAEASAFLQIPKDEISTQLEPIIPVLLSEIYVLESNPNVSSVNNLANNFTQLIISELIDLSPPPDSINDLPQLLTRWVLSEDKKTSLILVNYNSFNKTSEEMDEIVHEADVGIGELSHELKEEMNLTETRVYHTGEQYIMDVWMTQAEKDARLIDIVTILMVLVILLVIFCSLLAPFIPLIAIGSSIAASMSFLWFISFGTDIHFVATLFLTITSLGAGVDYCIFIFSRYSEERKKGHDKNDSLITAVTHAGESVFHSGLTVMVGFGAMIIPNFPLLRILGISMCIGISISLLSAIFVVPSIIMLLGDIIWWPKILQTILRPQKWFKKDDKDKSKINDSGQESIRDGESNYKRKEAKEIHENDKSWIVRFSNFVTKNGLVITIITLVVVAPFIYFAITMETSTDIMGMLPKDFEGTKGRDVLSESMAVGDPTPIELLFYNISKNPLDYDMKIETEKLCQEILRLDHVTTIKTTIRPLGITMFNTTGGLFEQYTKMFIGKDNRTLLLEIYLDVSPYSQNTEEFVETLPNQVNNIIEERSLTNLGEAKVYTLGFARGWYEIKNVTDNAFPIVVIFVIIGVYIVLFILFKSYFTPIRLIITIAIGIAFILGMLHLVFAVGFDVPIFWLLPLMLFSILMGLGQDYDIFLVTRIKEYYDQGLSNKKAIAYALDHTATIISSCGILMAAAYSSLMLSRLWHLREIGFAFTLGIILDATIIRIIIVPAIMVLMEKLNWVGPKWLQRNKQREAKQQTSEEINHQKVID